MHKLSTRQRTLGSPLEFNGFGVHGAAPSTVTLLPASPDSGIQISRILADGRVVGPVQVHFSRVTRTTLCTTLDLGGSVSVATIEHLVSALSGMGVDNVRIVIEGDECPILDGSAFAFSAAILDAGLEIQMVPRRFLRVLRPIMVRNNDAFAALEPYNGRVLDIEIAFDSLHIGRQRMIFDWSPRRYFEDVASARTFGFVRDAKILRQAGYALGSSLENSIAVDDDGVLNPGGLRFEDEFVRHKLLDAIGDLALGGLPLYGKFRSFKGGHALNALVLSGLFADSRNFEIVPADELPLAFDALDDLPVVPAVQQATHDLRSVG